MPADHATFLLPDNFVAAKGREDVLDTVEGGYEKVEDFEDAMALLNMIPTVI